MKLKNIIEKRKDELFSILSSLVKIDSQANGIDGKEKEIAFFIADFLKETGITIKDFITDAKIRTAENMLRYSDFSYSDISHTLGFSSQSAFISVFKKANGITPKKYREQHYVSDVLTKIPE